MSAIIRLPTQLETTPENRKSGQAVAKHDSQEMRAKGKRALPKTHVDYWKGRLEHRCYTREGELIEVNEWSVRIRFNGIRKGFPLGSSNKDVAAAKARDVYLSLVAKGWDATLREFATPGTVAVPVAVNDEPTVGNFLTEVQRTTQLKPRTFHRYAQYFRMLAAFVKGLDDAASKYDYRGGGRDAWLKRVDAVPLRAISPENAANWKLSYLARANGDPQKQTQVRRSFNAALRHCKSLFSKNVIYQPNFGVVVPRFLIKDGQRGERHALWFEVLRFEKTGSMKFHAPAGITYESLLQAARKELKGPQPEAYKLLLLCLCAGLRRAEADTLLWSQLDDMESCIRIVRTQYIEPKHDSGGVVYVESALITELKSLKNDGSASFVVSSTLKWKPTIYPRYRCQPHWETLNAWLEGKGITAIKKVHEMRKLFGDAIVKRQGIFAGAAQLRHSSIQMTTNHYTDPRQRAALPVSTLLKDQVKKKSRQATKQQKKTA